MAPRLPFLTAGLLASSFVHAGGADASVQFASVHVFRDQVRVSLYTLPGTVHAGRIIASIDANRDGVFSPAEDKAYAVRAFRELGIKIDGKALTPRLIRVNDSTPKELRGGAGSVEVVFYVDAPSRLGRHTLVWDNRHLPFIGKREFALPNEKDPGLAILSKAAKPDGSWAKVVYELRKEP